MWEARHRDPESFGSTASFTSLAAKRRGLSIFQTSFHQLAQLDAALDPGESGVGDLLVEHIVSQCFLVSENHVRCDGRMLVST
jgi:hypothetical protein